VPVSLIVNTQIGDREHCCRAAGRPARSAIVNTSIGAVNTWIGIVNTRIGDRERGILPSL